MVGEVVRAHRRRLGWTQEELAERSGVTVRTIGKIESGRITAPRPSTLRLLADALGVDSSELTSSSGTTVPAQLPPDVYAFTGRDGELEDLDQLLDGPGLTAVVVSA